MRILLVAPQPFFQERGTPLAVLLLAEALCDLGHRVDLLTFSEGRDVTVPGLRIVRVPAIPGVRGIPIGISWKKLVYDGVLCCALLWMTLRRRYDVIHAVEEAVFPAVLLRSWTRLGVIYDMDSSLGEQLLTKWSALRGISRLVERVESAAIKRASAVFAVCRDLAHRASAIAPAVPVFLIEDVALAGLPARTPAERLRMSCGIRTPIALYVGNLEPYQGVSELIEAVSLVPAQTELTLVLIGGTSDDVAQLRARARELCVERRVVAIGARPVACIADYLQQADILVSPRRHGNNTPMKVYSYMLSGRAILATRIRAHTQVLDDDCALLVEPTPAALAEGLVQLAGNAPLRERLGNAARNRAANQYSLELFRDKVRAAYESLESLPRRGSGEVSRVGSG
jgi:glycosyltransferase involved in cell wall biosynthesis